jgi:hypothetical protein
MLQVQEAARSKEFSGSATAAELGTNRYAVLPYRAMLFRCMLTQVTVDRKCFRLYDLYRHATRRNRCYRHSPEVEPVCQYDLCLNSWRDCSDYT